MDTTTFLIMLIIAIIFISIGFMITDTKYKIAYYMCVVLVALCLLNIYLSVVYYIQLRNTTGIQGPQGPKGVKGSAGASGKCSFSEQCGIKDPSSKILKISNTMYDISTTCLDKPSLANCDNSQDTYEKAMPINAQINMLEKIAYSTTMSEADFMSKLNVCLQDSNSCMDPTDF